MSEPLALLGVATCMWLAYRFHTTPSALLAIALGAVVGALAMTRSEELALMVLMVMPLVLSAGTIQWRRRVTWLAMAGITCVLVVTPWAIYNSTRFERTVYLSNGLGVTMAYGNCDATYNGELLGYYKSFCTMPAGLSSDQSVKDGQFRHAAIRYMSDHASRLPVVVAARLGRTFDIYRPFQQSRLEAERGHTPIWVEWIGLIAYWALIPLAVVGAVAARRRRIPIYPLIALPVIVVLAVAPTMGIVRYRTPAEIALVLLASFGIDVLFTCRWRQPRHWHGDDTEMGVDDVTRSRPDAALLGG